MRRASPRVRGLITFGRRSDTTPCMHACCDVAKPAERDRTTDSDSGAISAFVVVIFTALMILAGLVIDGGNMINARQKLIDDAEQAARLGANQIDEATLRSTGEVVVMWPDAEYEARGYLSELGYDPGDVDVSQGGSNEVVVVHISDTVDAQLLSLIGLGPFDVNGRAQARPAVGIVEEIP